MLAQLIVLSLISTKLQHYVLPIVPALAICVGAYLAQRPTEVAGKTAAGGLARAFGIGGLILMAVALVGEYVARIYDEVKKRPIYIVQETSRDGTAPSTET